MLRRVYVFLFSKVEVFVKFTERVNRLVTGFRSGLLRWLYSHGGETQPICSPASAPSSRPGGLVSLPGTKRLRGLGCDFYRRSCKMLNGLGSFAFHFNAGLFSTSSATSWCHRGRQCWVKEAEILTEFQIEKIPSEERGWGRGRDVLLDSRN